MRRNVVLLGDVVIYDPEGKVPTGFGRTEFEARADVTHAARALKEPFESLNGEAF